MLRKATHRSQSGFTILELLIASMIFSTILLLCTYGIIQIGNTYYRGGALVRTQNANRKAVDSLSSAIQYGGNDIVPAVPSGSVAEILVGATTTDVKTVCVGNLRLRFKTNKYVGQGEEDWAILSDQEGATCTVGSTLRGDGKELLGQGMRITELKITKLSSNYSIKLAIAFGSNDLIDNDTGLCKSGAGSQFCATSVFETTVQRRVQ